MDAEGSSRRIDLGAILTVQEQGHMPFNPGHHALTAHQVGWAITWLLLQAISMTVIATSLRRFKAQQGTFDRTQPNPFHQPVVIAATVLTAVAIFGMLFTVGRGWTIIIEAPLVVASTIGRVRQARPR